MNSESEDDRDLFEAYNENDNLSSQESIKFKCTDAYVENYKIFNDPIHGHIMLHPLLVKIIDTPQFQRLRNIKQLGSTYFVYPGGSHNRFEHCIGVSYLAEKLARLLKEKQEDLGITDKDVLCVAMAGLCHDLGHGPFSHMFDGMFIPKVRKGKIWTHEIGSCMMLDHLVEENNLKVHLDNYDINDDDITFVKEMIAGPTGSGDWPYLGRGEEKSFLYEIVSNERNKVDVDKWDYFARDCYHLGIHNSFDHNRFMHFIKVLRVEGERLQICARDKECFNLYEMFHTRSALHKRAYKHRVSTAIDLMLTEAFIIAEPHVVIYGRDDKPRTISECVDDPVAFTKLNDNIFDLILHSIKPELKPARDILLQIQKRQLFKCIGIIRPSKLDIDTSKIPTDIASHDMSGILKKEDIAINARKINYGMRDKNPIDLFKFFSKSNPTKAYRMRKEDVSTLLPSVFEDKELEVYCINDLKIEIASECFVAWSESLGLEVKSASETCDSLTPMKRSRPLQEGIENNKMKKINL